jgi:hypothetical protein
MWKWQGIAVAAVIVYTSPAATAEPKEIIEKAIKAHGGAEKLAKLHNIRRSTKGTLEIGGMNIDFSMEEFLRLPGTMKRVIEAEIQGNKLSITQLVDGENAWLVVGGQSVDIAAEEADSLRAGLHAEYVITLTPLLDVKKFQLDSLGEVKIDGKKSLGVKVKSKGKAEVDLYFDADSGLLVRYDHEALDPSKAKVNQAHFLTAYKEFNGIKQPTKLKIINGEAKFLEAEFTEYKLVEKFDPKEFEKP